MRYGHMDVPPAAPQVTRIELHGGRCACAKRFRAAPLADMPPGMPFDHNTHALLAYLHHSHHVRFERLARLAGELFSLSISEGAIANALSHRLDSRPGQTESGSVLAVHPVRWQFITGS